VVARELTKRFEEVRQGTLGELAERYAEETPKGEVVVLIAPPAPAGPGASDGLALDGALDEALDGALAEALTTLSLKEAVRAVAGRLGLPRRAVYARALEIAQR
jgi:16S rRNA (cytidine1402-2'-O)-methyltransferase